MIVYMARIFLSVRFQLPVTFLLVAFDVLLLLLLLLLYSSSINASCIRYLPDSLLLDDSLGFGSPTMTFSTNHFAAAATASCHW